MIDKNEIIEDAELSILENIYAFSGKDASPRQRDLAAAVGTSLGMTNAILKRLAQKGWIAMRKLNSRKVQYAITPDGVNEIAKRSYRYFKRTIKNVAFYKERIDEAVAKAKIADCSSVVLLGQSDLDFLVEHACNRHGLTFLKTLDARLAHTVHQTGAFVVYAESYDPQEQVSIQESLQLASILGGESGDLQ